MCFKYDSYLFPTTLPQVKQRTGIIILVTRKSREVDNDKKFVRQEKGRQCLGRET